MKIDRLISIIMILLECKTISAAKLAEMFEVTPRTIYRDIEAISLAGIPIVTYPGINGGIGILEQYKIDKKLFTTSDITTLLLGLSSIPQELSSEEVLHTLAKVRGLLPAEKMKDIEFKSSQITIDLTPWSGNMNLQPNLELIKRALDEKRLLSFSYSDFVGKNSIRKVEAYQLVLKGANWYLQAYCTSRRDFRIFKLARISAMQLLDEMFTPRQNPPLELNFPTWEESKLIRIKLLIDESLIERMLDVCGEENVEFLENNQAIAYYPFYENDFGYGFLLTLGDKCECLEPEHVRTEIIRRIRSLTTVYPVDNPIST